MLEVRKINIKTWKADLLHMFMEVDQDFTGDSGEGLSEGATKLGYDNELEYLTRDLKVDELNILDEVLERIETYFDERVGDYYTTFNMEWMYELDTQRCSTGNIFVAVSYTY